MKIIWITPLGITVVRMLSESNLKFKSNCVNSIFVVVNLVFKRAYLPNGCLVGKKMNRGKPKSRTILRSLYISLLIVNTNGDF